MIKRQICGDIAERSECRGSEDLTSRSATSAPPCRTVSLQVFLLRKAREKREKRVILGTTLFTTGQIKTFLPVMLFPSRLILSRVAISVSLSGKTEKLLLARLMAVKCCVSAMVSGSLVRTFPCRSTSKK